MPPSSNFLLGVPTSAPDLNPLAEINEPIPLFDLNLPDADLVRNLIRALPENISYWNKAPWQLERTDYENIQMLLGDQVDNKLLLPHETSFIDNRLFASTRSILAYVTAQLAKPEILPSRAEDRFQRIAKNLELMLYQHALDHEVNTEFRMAVLNLISRKRGVMKLKFDDDYGPFGDICTYNIDPADVVVSRFAKFGREPDAIFQRERCTVEELIERFPDKADLIKANFDIVRGTTAQMTREVAYWEAWFSYHSQEKGAMEDKEGVCWFLLEKKVVLGKMENPNWVYKGSAKHQRLINVTSKPIKPYIWLNYWNTGRSFIDETCLLDQAIPQQEILNKRGRQIVENADYANTRLIIDKNIMEESDAKKFVNKSPKTIGMVDMTQVSKTIAESVFAVPGVPLPSYVIQDKLDARTEIDELLGTPAQFRGANSPVTKPTLGQDLVVKNQASAVQDDLINVVNRSMRQYYTKLLQMMKVYLPDDFFVVSRGTDGEYAMLTLADDNLDTNVRIGVQVDSTLPIDKESQRATAIQLAQIPGRIDDLSLFKMLGLPDAEKLAERVQRFNIDRYTYMESIEQQLYDSEAEADIALVIIGKEPEERDDYSEDYLNHWNLFITTNRYARLPVAVQQRLAAFLQKAADKAATTEALRDSMLSPAGIIDRPPIMPLPKRTEQIRLVGQMDPQTTQNIAGGEAAMAVPLSQLQAAQNQGSQGANPQPGGQPSPPKVVNPHQFGP